MIVLLFILLASVNSFLLDNPQGNGGTAATNQYLTLSKFYEEMKLQQQDTTKLRHDTDNSLTLLTSQLQQKFDLLDKKLADIERQNETILDAANLEQKYKQLEQRYLNLEHNFNTLKIENNVLRNDRNRMENEISSLRNETNKELVLMKNKSLLVDKNIENLKQLGSIKPLHDLQMLQQEVKSISAQTSSLNMKEQARSQDFIALYSKVQKQGANSTSSLMNLINQMNTIQSNHNASIKGLDTQIRTLQTNHYTLITDLGTQLKFFQKNQKTMFARFESKINESAIRDNQKFTHLQQQIDNSTEQVALTAHRSSSQTTSGIIKFDDVQFSVGINNLSSYKSTGKFICEKGGLYLISASIHSNTNDAHYNIYLNGNLISTTEIIYNSNHPSMGNTGTVVAALQLLQNDSLWVSYPSNYYVPGNKYSTLTVIKLK